MDDRYGSAWHQMVDHVVRLTDSGQEIAEATYARNRAFRTMLASLSVDEKTSAHDACELEHAVSPENFAALQWLCPKTNTKENKPMKLDQMPACTCRVAAPDGRSCR